MATTTSTAQEAAPPQSVAVEHPFVQMSPIGKGRWMSAMNERLRYVPPRCRYDPATPFEFSMSLNVLFAFAGCFTVANLYYSHPILNKLAKDFGVSDEEASYIPTLAQAGYAAGLLFLCPLGDLLKRRPFVLWLVFFTATFWIGLCVTKSFAAFCAISFITSVTTVTPQLMLPLVGDLAPPSRRATSLSIVVSGMLLGMLIARVLSGVVTEYIGWRYVYWISFGLQSFILILLYLYMPDYPSTNPDESVVRKYPSLLLDIIKLIFKYPVLVQACLVGFFTSSTFTSYWTTLTFLLSGDPYNYNSLVIGCFAFIGILSMTWGPIFARTFMEKHQPLLSVIIGETICIVGIIIGTYTGLHTVAGPVIQAFCIDIGLQTSQIANRTAIFGVEPKGRNRVNTAYMVSVFLGQLMGTAAGNHLYAQGGWVRSGSASVGFVGAALVVCFVRGPHEKGWLGWHGGANMKKTHVIQDARKNDEETASRDNEGEEQTPELLARKLNNTEDRGGREKTDASPSHSQTETSSLATLAIAEEKEEDKSTAAEDEITKPPTELLDEYSGAYPLDSCLQYSHRKEQTDPLGPKHEARDAVKRINGGLGLTHSHPTTASVDPKQSKMARGNRKAAKASTPSTLAANASKSGSAAAAASLDPFVAAAAALPKLGPFLSTLPPTHVYLTSIDTTAPSIKRNAFLVPVVLNSLIALGLAYRVYTIAPTYLNLIVTIFGYDTAARVDTGNAGTGDLIGVVGSRTLLLMLDYALFTLVGAWPWQFLFGSRDNGYVGPAMWKWEVGGFPEREVVVRRSRRWDKEIVGGGEGGESAEKGKKTLTADDALTLKLKIAPAMDRRYLEKTGYAMLDRDWDLDFAGMVNAYQLVRGGELAFDDLENKAFVHDPAENEWLSWDVHRKEGNYYTPRTDEEKDIVEKFRDKLRAMGREDLFYRWIELVQYESSVPGGFTEGRQATAMREAKQMFEEKGIDFAKFWDEIGGREGMPGLDG